MNKKSPARNAIGMIFTSLLSPFLVDKFKDYDLILAHSQPSNWLAYHVKRKHGIPYVTYLHQSNRFLYPRNVDKITGWNSDVNMGILNWLHRFGSIIKKLDHLSIRNTNALLVNSEWIKEKVIKDYDIIPEVCYPGVEPRKRPMASTNLENPYILSTNRHYPQKALHLLLKSFSKIAGEYPQLNCMITGAYTPYTSILMDYAEKLGIKNRVTFTGNLSEEELQKIYHQAYMYSYTSPEEDFGLGPLEAGACGVPSIVWDHAGPRETVINGITGFRVKPYSLKNYAEKQAALLEDRILRDSMGKMAENFVRTTFPWERHIEKLENTFNRCLKT